MSVDGDHDVVDGVGRDFDNVRGLQHAARKTKTKTPDEERRIKVSRKRALGLDPENAFTLSLAT